MHFRGKARRTADGTETIVARSVIGYDLSPDGSVLFTDGRAVYACAPGGQPERVREHFPIEKVTALE